MPRVYRAMTNEVHPAKACADAYPRMRDRDGVDTEYTSSSLFLTLGLGETRSFSRCCPSKSPGNREEEVYSASSPKEAPIGAKGRRTL